MVGRARSAGTVHRAQHRHARRHHDRSRTPTRGTNRTTATGTKRRRRTIREFVEQLVPALPGTARQVSAGPAVLRQHRAAARSGRPRYRRAFLQLEYQAARRQARSRSQLQGAAAGSCRHDGARYRARPGRPDPAGGLADRHLHRRLALPPRDVRAHRYKSAATVIRMLIDIVSKNGNLLLNIPLRGDGTIDEDETKVLDELATWMPANGEAIYGTRPYACSAKAPPT